MRLPVPVGLSGPAVWLPPTEHTSAQAVAEGLISAETAEELGHRALPVAEESAPEMAVRAGKLTLERAGVHAEDICLLLHAWIHYQGHDLWSPAHYIAHGLGAHAATPIGIQQMCNGGATAIELAVTRLLTEPGAAGALVTTGDRFAGEGFARWTGDFDIAYGDGATSLLVHPVGERGADLSLHALASVAAPDLERMHRGSDPFSPAPRTLSDRVDVRRTKKAYLESEGFEGFARAGKERLETAISRCLADAGMAPDDPRLRYVVPPRLGLKTLEAAFLPAFADATPAKVLNFGTETGHLGAGDAAANIEALHSTQALDPGEYALVISAGGGFTWSSLLISRPKER